MTDDADRFTPNPIVPTWATERDCAGRHERTNEALAEVRATAQRVDRQTIACCGQQGGGGLLAQVARATEDHEMRLRKVESAVVRGQLLAAGLFALASWLLHRFGG